MPTPPTTDMLAERVRRLRELREATNVAATIAAEGWADRSYDPNAPTAPRVVVTPHGLQALLPGHEPAPVAKGEATQQTTMF